MSICPPGEPVQGADFNVVPEPVLVIEDMFEDQARVDDVAGVGIRSVALSRRGVGIEDGCADANGFEVLSRHESLRQPIFAESRAGKSAQWRESAWWLVRIGPAAGGKHDLCVMGQEGRQPPGS